jgi:small conductance mechanosensitive channel
MYAMYATMAILEVSAWQARSRRLMILALACLLAALAVRLAARAIYRALKSRSGAERRARTLGSVAGNTANAIVTVFFLLAVLGEMGVNIGPLLAGASIVGVALGFGTQTLVKDVLSGLFMLIEDQFGVGDIIDAGGSNIGTVERMTLRITVLRDVEGRAHYVPNGSISRVIVLSKEFARALVDVEVGHDYGPDRVMALLRDIGAEMQRDMPEMALEPTDVKGIDEISQSAYVIRTLTKCARSCQWDVAREYRRRVLVRFAQEGISIPVQRVIVRESA